MTISSHYLSSYSNAPNWISSYPTTGARRVAMTIAITKGNSHLDVQKVKDVTFKAFNTIKFPAYLRSPGDDEHTVYTTHCDRIQAKIDAGAVVLHDDDYSVVAIWYPPDIVPPVISDSGTSSNLTKFLKEYKYAANKCFPTHGPHYELNILARDPGAKGNGKSVTSIVKPMLEKAVTENLAVSLMAVDHHARDVYVHWGFKSFHSFMIEDVEINYMLYNYKK